MQIQSEWWWLGIIPIAVGIFLIYMLWNEFQTWRQASNMRKELSVWESFNLFFSDIFFYIVFYLIAMFLIVQMLIDEGTIILT